MKFLKLTKSAGAGFLGVVTYIFVILVQLFFYGAMIALALWLFHTVTNHFKDTDSNSNSSATELRSSYIAAQDSFEINFPSNPQITNTDELTDPSGVKRTARTYSYENTDDDKSYNVVVIHYNVDLSQLSDADTKSSLQSEMNWFAQESNVQLENVEFINFQGYTALQADLSDEPVLIFIRGYDEFVISTSGVASSDYNSFVNSFKSTL